MTTTGGIYQIVLRESRDVLYVGSTMNYVRREAAHRYMTRHRATVLHSMIRDIGGFDQVEFVRVYPTDLALTRRERTLLEQNTIEEAAPQFNFNRAHAPVGVEYYREYRIANRERTRAYMCTYRAENRERIRGYALAQRERTRAARTLAGLR